MLAEHDAVSTSGDDRRAETQLRVAVADADNPAEVLGGSVMDVESRAVGDLPERLQGDVEPVADRVRAFGDECVAAPEVASLDSGKGQRDALAGLRALDGAVVDLDAADAHVEAGGLGPELVAAADRARPERARDDRADALEREDTVDVEPRGPVGRPRLDPVRGLGERRPQRIEPFARAGARRHDGRLGDELARLLERELARLVVHRVDLRERDDALLDPEQPDDRQVLVRLGPGSFAGVDGEQEEVDPGRAGDHVADEALVAGNVDEGKGAAVAEVERRVPEVDRDAALLLLGEPVRVLARQRANEPGLAVVDMAGGAYRERHVATASATSSTSASVSVRQSSRSRSSRTIPTTAGSPSRSASASSSSSTHA